MGQLYHELLFRPLYNLLVGLYDLIPGQDIGLAIIILTLIIRFILWPLTLKALRSQKEIQQLQPKITELQQKLKDKREELARQTLALYREHKVNPFASIVPTIIQLVVLIALYQAFNAGFDEKSLSLLYSFVPNPGPVSHFMFGVFDLTKPSPALAVVAGAAQFIFSKLMFQMRLKPQPAQAPPDPTKPDMQRLMQTQMTYFLPVFTVVIGLSLPAALALYWIVTTVFSIGQEIYLFRGNKTVVK